MGSSPRSGCGCKKSWTPSLCFLLKSHRGHRLGARAMQPVRCREISVPRWHLRATAFILRSPFGFALELPGLSLTTVVGTSVLRVGRATRKSHSVVLRPPHRLCEQSCELCYISASESWQTLLPLCPQSRFLLCPRLRAATSEIQWILSVLADGLGTGSRPANRRDFSFHRFQALVALFRVRQDCHSERWVWWVIHYGARHIYGIQLSSEYADSSRQFVTPSNLQVWDYKGAPHFFSL